jgi:alpha-1,6-mannosyltransferase
LVVLEAWAWGRRVGALRAGALPELIDSNAGVMAEPHEDEELATASLAAAVSSLYERDLDALGAAARRHVESNYSWSRALQGLMMRYQAAVSARQRVAVDTALPSAGTIQ